MAHGRLALSAAALTLLALTTRTRAQFSPSADPTIAPAAEETPSATPFEVFGASATASPTPSATDDAANASLLAATTAAPLAATAVMAHPERELVFAAVLCRHGDRSPIAEFPNDALPASKWPMGPGQLTPVGQRAHYELGARLRQRYVVDQGFLPTAWTPKDIYIRSTTIDRTLMSAYSQFAGLYPAGTGDVVDVRMRFGGMAPSANETGLPGRWQPVPIHSAELALDGLLIAGGNCPRHLQIMDEKRRSAEYVEKEQSESALLAKLTTIVGSEEPLTLHQVNDVNDIWVVFESHGVPLPSGVSVDMRQKVHEIATWLLIFGNEGSEVRRLRAGNLLRELGARMNLAKSREAGTLAAKMAHLVKKFVLYSAHDTTVAALLSAMDVKFDTNPPYNSTLIWELLHDTVADEYLVRVEYNGVPKNIPGCTNPASDDFACPLDDYLEATDAVTFINTAERERECNVGLKRQYGYASSWFKQDPEDPLDLGTNGWSGVPEVSLNWVHLTVLLTIASVAFGLVYKARRKYMEYFVVQSDEVESLSGGGDRTVLAQPADKRILL